MTIKEVRVAEAKKHFSDLLGRVAYRGERITISKRGKPMAIVVPAAEVRGQSPRRRRVKLVRAFVGPRGDPERACPEPFDDTLREPQGPEHSRRTHVPD